MPRDLRKYAIPLVLIPVFAIASVLSRGTANAATQPVQIVNFSFQPGTVTISQGTTVAWTNQDTAPHTATSDTGAFDTGRLSQGQSGSITFNQAGTFPYHCSVHPNMHGTVIVQAAAVTAAPTSTTAAAAATATATSVPLAASPVGLASRLNLGPAKNTSQITWEGFYDGHHDAYINTDVSDRSQAKSLHANFAPLLTHSGAGALSPMYFVKGRAAAGQIAVFGSEPGGSDYSPLWSEIIVRWKAGVKPVLLTKDDQIKTLAKAGKLTMQQNKIVLNAPIVGVGR